jgi:hypothetical protein
MTFWVGFGLYGLACCFGPIALLGVNESRSYLRGRKEPPPIDFAK